MTRILEPDLEIIDPHHHLYPMSHWVAGGKPFLLQEFAEDLNAGHKIVSTVYIECSQLYRQTGPAHLRPAGEAEFSSVTARLAETGHFGPARVCEGFVGTADLLRPDTLDEVLDALDHASDGRLRGIRYPANWDPDPQINPSSRPYAIEGVMLDETFRKGVSRLTARGLVYEAFQYYPQLPELVDLAAAQPDTVIVCNHVGGLVGKRAYATPENFANWKARVLELAERPNVLMKLGGLANERTNFGFSLRPEDIGEDELVDTWGPYIKTCIDAFGPDRCMFESNFPVDRCATDYVTLWNVFKRIAAGYSPDEKADLFAGTARRTYRLK